MADMSPPAVRKRGVSSVALRRPPGGGRRVPLSPFDAYWVALPPVCRVFLFPAPLPAAAAASPVSFRDVVRVLRESLEAVLPAFYPFAGAFAYSTEEHAVSVVVSPEGDGDGEGGCGGGVAFVEAETDLDFGRLVDEGEEHDEDALRQLVPDIGRDELPAPLMAVQVTEFVGAGGGVALGMAMHHAVADGRGLWRFLETWSAAAAAVVGKVLASPTLPPPVHDRRLVRLDGDEELTRLFLQQLAPELPKIVHVPRRRGQRLSRRTFTFTASAVKLLKRRAAAAGGGSAPSTFAAMAAHGWVSIARASGLTDGDDKTPVFAVFLADCRAAMSPPVPDAYAGNCVALCVASLGAGSELAGPDGHARAFTAIKAAVDAVRLDPLGNRARWCTMFADIPAGRAVIMAGSPWFAAYAVDLGFGRPSRAELVSMNHDGEMVLVAGREVGSVQASVASAVDVMPAFCELFVVKS